MKRSIAVFSKGIIPVMVALVFVVAVSGCQRQEGKEGTMEKAGKKIDESVDATKKAMDKAGEKVSEGVEATKDTMKQVGEKVSEGAEATKEAVESAAQQATEKAKE